MTTEQLMGLAIRTVQQMSEQQKRELRERLEQTLKKMEPTPGFAPGT